MKKPEPACPCGSGSGSGYGICCGRFIDGTDWPDTAEILMRSRYTAYVKKCERYLLQTWHASSRPAQLDLHQDVATKWLDLTILDTRLGGTGDEEGTVEFVARYKNNGKMFRLHECSHFRKEDGQWFYLNGQHE